MSRGVAHQAGSHGTADTGAHRGTRGVPTEVRERLTIGTVDGPAEYAFTHIGALDVDSRGNVFVFDLGQRRVRKFSPAGQYLLEMGGDGGGPGEFRRGPAGLHFDLGGMALIGDSLVVVHDPWAWQLVYFDTAGTYRRGVRLPEPPPFGVFLRRSLAVADLGSGSLLLHFARPFGVGPRATEEDGTHVLLRLRVDGTRFDTLARYSQDDVVSGSESDWRGELFPKPFAPQWHWAVGPGGVIAFGHGSRYEITIHSPSWEPLFRLARDVDDVAVTSEHAARFRRRFPFGAGMESLSPSLRRQATSVLRNLDFPAVWPAFDQLVYDAEGRLWVRRPVLPEASTAEWDLFDGLQRYLGSVRLPADLWVRKITNDRIYAVARDALDVQIVKVFELVGEPNGE